MGYHDMARVMFFECKRLRLTAFDQHALRYGGVLELAWSECPDDEIASYSGHTKKALIVKYAGEAQQKIESSTRRRKAPVNKTRPNPGLDTRGDIP